MYNFKTSSDGRPYQSLSNHTTFRRLGAGAFKASEKCKYQHQHLSRPRAMLHINKSMLHPARLSVLYNFISRDLCTETAVQFLPKFYLKQTKKCN